MGVVGVSGVMHGGGRVIGDGAGVNGGSEELILVMMNSGR